MLALELLFCPDWTPMARLSKPVVEPAPARLPMAITRLPGACAPTPMAIELAPDAMALVPMAIAATPLATAPSPQATSLPVPEALPTGLPVTGS